MNLLSYQQKAFNDLLKVGNVFFSESWHTLPVTPRFSTLIAGPSGSGKTYLAKAVADALERPFLAMDISSWIVLGANSRGPQAWHTIAEFVERSQLLGGVLFVDEICKLSGLQFSNGGSGEWSKYLATEVLAALDARVPPILIRKKEKGTAIVMCNVQRRFHPNN